MTKGASKKPTSLTFYETDEGIISKKSSEDDAAYYTEVTQPKTNKNLVLFVTISGSTDFKRKVLASLKYFDNFDDDDDLISVDDIHGCNVLKPDFNLSDKE